MGHLTVTVHTTTTVDPFPAEVGEEDHPLVNRGGGGLGVVNHT